MPLVKINCRSCQARGGFEVPGQSITEQRGWRKCDTCKGTCVEWVSNTCPRCLGTRKVVSFGVTVQCGQCLGKGTVAVS